MGKDKRSNQQRCLRCSQWAEYQSELCIDCEEDALGALAPPMGAEEFIEKVLYCVLLDQERAESMEGE